MKWNDIREIPPPTFESGGKTYYHTVLVTNNLQAKSRQGRMSHLWLAMPYWDGQQWMALPDGCHKVWGVTHWADPEAVRNPAYQARIDTPSVVWHDSPESVLQESQVAEMAYEMSREMPGQAGAVKDTEFPDAVEYYGTVVDLDAGQVVHRDPMGLLHEALIAIETSDGKDFSVSLCKDIRAALAAQASGQTCQHNPSDNAGCVSESQENEKQARGRQDRVDAERYRFARDNIKEGHELPGGYYLDDESGQGWDKTIDAARAAAKGSA